MSEGAKPTFAIALLPGDGIGPEITEEALRVLDAVSRRFHHEFQFIEAYAGGEAWERYGERLPAAPSETCRSPRPSLKGPFGGTAGGRAPPRGGVADALLGRAARAGRGGSVA